MRTCRERLELLTAGISQDVVTAMEQLVRYILRSPSGDGPLDKDQAVTLEQAKLQQLCLYQLILGYKLREAGGQAGYGADGRWFVAAVDDREGFIRHRWCSCAGHSDSFRFFP